MSLISRMKLWIKATDDRLEGKNEQMHLQRDQLDRAHRPEVVVEFVGVSSVAT